RATVCWFVPLTPRFSRRGFAMQWGPCPPTETALPHELSQQRVRGIALEADAVRVVREHLVHRRNEQREPGGNLALEDRAGSRPWRARVVRNRRRREKQPLGARRAGVDRAVIVGRAFLTRAGRAGIQRRQLPGG